MPKVNPVGMLNTKAHNMIAGYITDSPDKHKYAQEFFGFANKYNIQGPAVVSYFTSLHNMELNHQLTNNTTIKNVGDLRKYVRDLIAPKQEKTVVNNIEVINADEAEAKAEAREFVKTLNEMYPKNLRTRISLSDQSAVLADKIKKVSWKTKALVRINLLLDKLMTKYEPAINKIKEFCKPVE